MKMVGDGSTKSKPAMDSAAEIKSNKFISVLKKITAAAAAGVDKESGKREQDENKAFRTDSLTWKGKTLKVFSAK